MTALPIARPSPAPVPALTAQLLRGDPLARFLIRSKLSPLRFGLWVLAFSAAYTVVLPALFGSLFTAGGVSGALADWPYLIRALVLVPVLCAYYARQPVILQTMYDQLAQRLGNTPEARVRAERFIRPVAWPVWAWLALGIGALEVVIWVAYLRQMNPPTWLNTNGLLIVCAQVPRLLGFYVVTLIVVRQLIALGRGFGRGG